MTKVGSWRINPALKNILHGCFGVKFQTVDLLKYSAFYRLPWSSQHDRIFSSFHNLRLNGDSSK